MRYELADYEWVAIKPMLPNKPRGVPRVNAGFAWSRRRPKTGEGSVIIPGRPYLRAIGWRTVSNMPRGHSRPGY